MNPILRLDSMTPNLIGNLWVLVAGLLVFSMTISVGFLEIGELNSKMDRSLLKTLLITVLALFVMGAFGFNIAFAPLYGGFIGDPLYHGAFLGLFSSKDPADYLNVFWSMGPSYFNAGLFTGTYFFFETAFASVTLALVAVIVLRKMKMSSFAIYSVVYFLIIWTLPAAWIWNPEGWLFKMGVRDFAGGLIVHGAAGFAALAILLRIWQEEKAHGLKRSIKETIHLNKPWLTLSILLLWMGWFGFNPGSELFLGAETVVVGITTFLAASSAMVSTMLTKYILTRENPGLLYAVNGVLMGLIIITPLAGFVSPGSAVLLGIIGGPLFIWAEKAFSKAKWFSDPVGVLPGHAVGGVFGLLMIAFFTQRFFALQSGDGVLPNGLFFGGGLAALRQLGLEIFAVIVVGAFVFTVSYVTLYVISKTSHGILTDYIERNTEQDSREDAA